MGKMKLKKTAVLIGILIFGMALSSCGEELSKASESASENAEEAESGTRERSQYMGFEILNDLEPISREQGTFPVLPYYGWPSVAVDENDVTYAVVSKRLLHIDPYGKVMLYKSYDKGKTWDEGTVLVDTILDDRDAGILYMGKGRFLVTTFSHNAGWYKTNDADKWLKWQGVVGEEETKKVFDNWTGKSTLELSGCSSYIISDDYGETWSDAKKMPITAPHGPSLMKNGDLMYVGVPKAPELCGEKLTAGVYFYRSTDRGESWEKVSMLPFPQTLNPQEAYGIETSDGTILASIRSNTDYHTYICKSKDGGKTWDKPQDITYGFPAHLLETKDGKIILSYSTRTKEEKGEHFRVSTDGGKTWSEDETLSTVQNPDTYNTADIGYPMTAEYSDGTFITVYYQICDGDTTPSLCRTLWKMK